MEIKQMFFWSLIAYGLGAVVLLGLVMLPAALLARCAFSAYSAGRKKFEPLEHKP